MSPTLCRKFTIVFVGIPFTDIKISIEIVIKGVKINNHKIIENLINTPGKINYIDRMKKIKFFLFIPQIFDGLNACKKCF